MSNNVQTAFSAVTTAIGDATTAVSGKIQNLDTEVSPLLPLPAAFASSHFYTGLKTSCTTINSAAARISAKGLILSDIGNNFMLVKNLLTDVNFAISGPNGLDTGAVAANTLYSLWVIGDTANNVAGLFSLSATAPTLPGDYTFKYRVGWIRTDVNKNIMPFTQNGAEFHFIPMAGSGLTAIPQVGTGKAGDVTIPTWVAIDLTPWVPSTAVAVRTHVRGLAANVLMAAPNNGYGPYNDVNNPPPVDYVGVGSYQVGLEKLPLESMTIYWANNAGSPVDPANTTGPFGSLGVFGWTDSL